MTRKLKSKCDIDVRAAALASWFSKEIKLPAGNLWEPAIARCIAADMRKQPTQLAEVESLWAFKLGLGALGIPVR